MRNEAFKKAVKERISNLLKRELDAKMDDFVEGLTGDSCPDEKLVFSFEKTFEADVVKFLKAIMEG